MMFTPSHGISEDLHQDDDSGGPFAPYEKMSVA